jgi:hypothetical protein
MTVRYAAYGSNLHPLRLKNRISSARFVTTSVLDTWSLHFHKRSKDGSGKCNILSGESGVHVAIFEISAADKLALDAIEGLGFGYGEVALSIPDVGDCFAYVAADSHIDDSLLPYDWYKELVLIGARTHRFPAEYQKRIDSIPARRDPHPTRSVENWKIVDVVKAGS